MPDFNFKQDAFDYFINELTNVTGLHADPTYKHSVQHWGTEGSFTESEKAQLAKISTISMFIPKIPHYIINIFGPTGVVKSTFEEQVNDIVDPTHVSKFLPKKNKDFDLIIGQNHLICFDNYSSIDKATCDKIAAATTGAGDQTREYYTTKKMTNNIMKVAFMFSSINRLFTELDILTRLMNFEFMPLSKESGYKTETEIKKKFQEIKPQLLGYIFYIISKAINIRYRIIGEYKLARLADTSEWSEAISQAMGYQPGSYTALYNRLDEIQRKYASAVDPLIHYYYKIYSDIFEKSYSSSVVSDSIKEVRENRYVIYNYSQMQNKLDTAAQIEGYDIKKSNKEWPQDSRQLAIRTREVSYLIEQTFKFLIQVRRGGKDNENEYILGSKEAVEKYLGTREEKSNQDFVNYTIEICVRILRDKEDQIIPYDMLLQLATLQNPNIQTYLNGNYKLENNIPLRKIIDGLRNHNLAEEIKNQQYVSFRYRKAEEHSNNSNLKHESEDQQTNEILNNEINSKPITLVHNNLSVNSVQNRRGAPFQLSNFGSTRSLDQVTQSWKKEIGLTSRNVRGFTEESSIFSDKKKVTVQIKLKTDSQFYSLVPQFKNYAACDCEWYREDLEDNKISGKAGMLYCFCLVDNQGHETKLHLDDFNGHNGKFMSAVLDVMQKYDALVGYAILAKKEEWMRHGINGDVEQIRSNCNRVGLLERFEMVRERIKFLDLHSVFTCGNVKSFLEAGENVKYRGETLEAVATAYLKEGKYENVKGADAEFLEPRMQLDYCMQDAKLCLKLSQKDDYRVLTIFHNLSKEIGKDHNFFITCNYAKPTAWWRDFLKPLGYESVTGAVLKWQEEHLRYTKNGKKKGVYYNGGKVFEPIAGLHNDVITYDVSSMYPKMAIIHNISSETINCECCKDDPSGRIPDAVMNRINDDLVTDGYQARPWHYWICKRRRGIFSNVMEMLYKKKADYKKQGLTLEEKAVKLFANSGYGTFGQVNFEYYDFRVTELVTGFARHTLIGLRDLFQDNNIQVLYGDTDSLFVKTSDSECNNTTAETATVVDIVDIAKQKFQVDLDKDKIWKLLALTENKKAYFGMLNSGRHCYKTLPGLKSNYPLYDNEVVSQLTSKETLELFLNPDMESKQHAKEHVIKEVSKAFHILVDKLLIRDKEYVKLNLCYSEEASKPLYEYEGNCWQTYLYNEILNDCNGDRALAEMNSRGKSVYSYWKITGNEEQTATMHPEEYVLDVRAYKRDLWTCVELILRVYGLSKDECSRLENKLVNKQLEL